LSVCVPVVFFTLCILLSFVLVFGSSVDVNDSGLYPACKAGDASCRVDSNLNGSGYCCPIGDDAEANWMQTNPTVMCNGGGKCAGSSSSSSPPSPPPPVASPLPPPSSPPSQRAKNHALYPKACFGEFSKGTLKVKAGMTSTFPSGSCPSGLKPALTLLEVAAQNGVDTVRVNIDDASHNRLVEQSTSCFSQIYSDGVSSMGSQQGIIVSITCTLTKGTCHLLHSVTYTCIPITKPVSTKSQVAPGSLQPIPAPKPSVPVPISVPTPAPAPTPASPPAVLQSIKSSPPATPAPAKISIPTTQQSGSAAVAGLSIFNLLLCLIAVISFLVM
jgi:hypothetical protein